MKIPFNRPVKLSSSFDEIRKLQNEDKLSAGGRYSHLCEDQLGKINQSENLLVPSATAALEMMALLLKIGPEDEVILPSFTFVSTANAFSLRGANIKFADVDPNGNILLSEIERLTTSKTKAVCAVHYAGNSAPLNPIIEYCKSKSIELLEDAAQCAGSAYNNKPLGTFGRFGCYSFHDTKNITSGEGGCLIINDLEFKERSEVIREKGTNRKAFLKGMVDKYTWIDLGSSFCLSELNSAYLLPQIENLSTIVEKRKKDWDTYCVELENSFEKIGAKILKCPEYNTPNYHMFAIIFKSEDDREQYRNHMLSQEIVTAPHYVPLHSSPYGKRYGSTSLPESENLSKCLLRLPMFFNLKPEELEKVISVSQKYLNSF